MYSFLVVVGLRHVTSSALKCLNLFWSWSWKEKSCNSLLDVVQINIFHIFHSYYPAYLIFWYSKNIPKVNNYIICISREISNIWIFLRRSPWWLMWFQMSTRQVQDIKKIFSLVADLCAQVRLLCPCQGQVLPEPVVGSLAPHTTTAANYTILGTRTQHICWSPAPAPVKWRDRLCHEFHGRY